MAWRGWWSGFLVLAACALLGAVPLPAASPTNGVVRLSDADRRELEAGLNGLLGAMVQLVNDPGVRQDRLPDVMIFHSAVDTALRHDELQHTNDVVLARRLLEMGRERARLLAEGFPNWLTAKGLVVRGFVSRIDGSVQPYGVVVGKEYRAGGRLDVWLHGRDERLTELRFLGERLRSAGEFAPEDAVVVHPYGRYCNAYKFAGETDVLEAMAHATESYGADPARRAIRGFSMGGAGVWHLAVHHPGLWRAAAPGAGFAETAEYTGILTKGPVPPAWEQRLWRWYDAPPYAGNLRHVPMVAYSGEKDRQIQAARVMERALAAEGLKLDHVIGPGVEHKYETGAKAEVARRVDGWMSARAEVPKSLDLTTLTLRYPGGEGTTWIRFEGLAAHWERSRIRATVTSEDRVEIRTEGVTALTVLEPPGLGKEAVTVEVDGSSTRLGEGTKSFPVSFRKVGGRWERVAEGELARSGGKRPGLQGPIDDAYMDAFLVVVPTRGKGGWADQWVDRQWRQFTNDWRAQFRGDCRVIRDVDVTFEQMAGHAVSVWGTPESNVLLERMAGELPLQWKPDGIWRGGQKLGMGQVIPAFIAPNPLVRGRYVVVNSGHTFARWTGTNARQTPRLGDWALIGIENGGGERVLDSGFLGEDWR